jgi:hypothetical protein
MLARSGHDPLVARRLFRLWWHRNADWYIPAAFIVNSLTLVIAMWLGGVPSWPAAILTAVIAWARLVPRMIDRTPRYVMPAPGPDLEPPKMLLPEPLPPIAEKLVQEAVQRHYEAEATAAQLEAHERFRMDQLAAQSRARANLSQNMVDMQNRGYQHSNNRWADSYIEGTGEVLGRPMTAAEYDELLKRLGLIK